MIGSQAIREEQQTVAKIADTLQQQSRQMDQRTELLTRDVARVKQEQTEAIGRLDEAISRVLLTDTMIPRIEAIVNRLVEEAEARKEANRNTQ